MGLVLECKWHVGVPSLKRILTGFSIISGSWCEHWLNEDAANFFSSHSLSLGMFVCVDSNGSLSGHFGVVDLFGQVHFVS